MATDRFLIYDELFTFTNWNEKSAQIEDFKILLQKIVSSGIEPNTL
jgi:hypothetical protein